MSLKLKINTNKSNPQDGSVPPTPNPASGAATPATGGGFKLKLNASQPPTPASERANSLLTPTAASSIKTKQGSADKSKNGKKRTANDDTISPAAKRPAKNLTHARKFSLKGPVAPPPQPPSSTLPADEPPLPSTTAKRIVLGKNRKKARQPTLRGLNVKRPPPKRLAGQGYDSEDSSAEEDPAIQQAFILRMEPGEDCEYLRTAIANGKIGVPTHEGPAEVSLRFIEKDFRRAVVNVRGRKYAAVLVDLPCIVETMKSWDRKGWWKVADLNQMLLVLGRCGSDEEAKVFPLPRGVEKGTFQFAHGLTPPMRWVRRRRFRKRLSYKSIANVEEEVERLLREDELVEASGGRVDGDVISRGELERGRSRGLQDEEEDGEEGDDAVETVENEEDDEEEYYSDEGDADLEGNLQAMFDEDHASANVSSAPATELVTESPKPLADQAASFAAVENAMLLDSPATDTQTPAGEATTQDEASSPSSDEESDEDEEEEDSPDVLDEDAAAQAAERNQQLEEVADLEREVEAQRVKVGNMKNMLLKERAVVQLKTLEEDLRVKRVAIFGVDDDGGVGGEGEGD